MPMIYVEWLPRNFGQHHIVDLCRSLDGYLRRAIRMARPSVNHEYKVMIRGNPHPNIAIGIPDLEIRIEYHEEWMFTEAERSVMSNELASDIETHLQGEGYDGIKAKLRFYSLTGYKGVDLKFD